MQVAIAHQQSLRYLLRISRVEEIEVFKICLEYWHWLAAELYRQNPYPLMTGNQVQLMKGRLLSYRLCLAAFAFMQPMHGTAMSGRRRLYNDTLSSLRYIMISRMVKPEEVLVVENEQGEVVRETIKNTDNLALYQTMKECLG